MPETASPLIDALAEQFGSNYVFVLDLLDQYQRDPQSVDASWRDYFESLNGTVKEASVARPAETPAPAPVPAPAPAPEARPAAQAMITAAAPMMRRAADKSLMVPTILPGDIA